MENRPKRIVRQQPRKAEREDHLWGFLAGFLAMRPRSYLYIDHVPEEEQQEWLPSASACCAQQIPKPDEKMERQLERNNLSEESRYVINLVLSMPGEAVEWITTPLSKRITKIRIGRYLEFLGWPPETIQKTFQELRSYVQELG